MLVRLMVAGFVFAGWAPLFAATPSTPPATTQAAGEMLEIVFDPPLDQPVRYTLSRSQPRGEGIEETSIGVEISFRRDGDRYRMTMTYALPPGAGADPASALMQRPIVFDVSAEGVIERVFDETAYWTALEAFYDALAANDEKEGARSAGRAMVSRMRSLPDEARVALLSNNIAPVLQAAATALPLREPVRTSERRDSLLGLLDHEVETRVEQVESDNVRIVIVATLPPEQLAEGIKGLTGTFGADPAEVEIKAYRERAVFDVSRRTGLTRNWTSERIIEAVEGGIVRRTVATRSLSMASPGSR